MRGSRIVCNGALAILCGLWLGGCGMDVLHPEGPVGNREVRLITISALLMCLVVLPVFFMTIFFAWRYRADKPRGAYAPDTQYPRRLDMIIWGGPAVIVLFLIVFNWRATLWLNPYEPLPIKAPVLVVDVVAMDWKWLFIYPDQGIASLNQAAIPVGTQVDFRITSDTVMNVFFIPQLGTQIYAMSGMMTQVHLIAKNPGRYRGLSANFSGPGFPDMRFTAIATSPAGFSAWVKQARASPAVLDAKGYQFMSGPNGHVPVSFFGHVQPGLFADILAAHDSAAKQLPREETE